MGKPKAPTNFEPYTCERSGDAVIVKKMLKGLHRKGDFKMTERMIVNRVRKLKELEAQQKKIEEQIDALKAEIKADMQRKDLEEQKAGDYMVRFTTVISNRFDGKAFKADHAKLYDQYMRTTESRRFSIA